jgi:hypothetical protein
MRTLEDTLTRSKKSIAKRITVLDNGCAIWAGNKTSTGTAGTVVVNGKPRPVHHYLWNLSGRPRLEIGKNQVIRKTCSTAMCVAPDHYVRPNSKPIRTPKPVAKVEAVIPAPAPSNVNLSPEQLSLLLFLVEKAVGDNLIKANEAFINGEVIDLDMMNRLSSVRDTLRSH